jgi:hypothetical protein
VLALSNYVVKVTGNTDITGWTVTGLPGDGIALVPDTYIALKASDGRQWVDLTGVVGYNKGLVSNSMATTIGDTYRLSFDIGNWLTSGPLPSTLGVSFNGGGETLFTNPSSVAPPATSPMTWATFTTDWVANSSSVTLSFVGRSNGASSNDLVIGLDNVRFEQLAAVPEPGTWALWMGGLAGVMAGARQRRAGAPRQALRPDPGAPARPSRGELAHSPWADALVRQLGFAGPAGRDASHRPAKVNAAFTSSSSRPKR